MPKIGRTLNKGRYRKSQTEGGIGTLGSDEEMRNTINFFVIVVSTIAIISFLVAYKFNAMVVSNVAMSKYTFCENPTIEINEKGYKTVFCGNWIDVSVALEKLDGNYLILKRGNILIFSLDENSLDTARIMGNSVREKSCVNVEPDYEGGVYRMVTGTCSKDSTLIDYFFNFVKPNEEISQRFNFAPDVKMKNMLLSTFDVIEIDGIFDNKIIKIEDGKSKEIELSDNVPSLFNEYGLRYRDVYYNTSNSEICKGCLSNASICISVGNSWNMQYCDVNNVLKDKKAKGGLCSNNYECISDLCNGKCVEPGIITNIGKWLKEIFG